MATASFDPIAFVERHGLVLASAKGPLPNFAEAVAGGPIQGSWWGHPAGKAIFDALNRALDSPDIVDLRLCGHKRTLVHRRVWPAVVRLARRFDATSLASVTQEHTETGAHRNVVVDFPDWVPGEVLAAGTRLSEEEAIGLLGVWVREVKG